MSADDLGTLVRAGFLELVESIPAPPGTSWRVVGFQRWKQRGDAGDTTIRLDVKDGDEVTDLYLVAAATEIPAVGRAGFRPAIAPPPKNEQTIPACRLDLIDWLLNHPGEWVEYTAAGDDDYAAPTIRYTRMTICADV